MRVDVIGEEELARKLARLQEQVQGQQLAAAVTAGALLIQDAAKIKAPARTGNLRRSIHTELTAAGPTRAEATVGTDAVYAAQVEFGGTIVPKRKRVLRWVDESGQEHFARSVTQPARPYLRPAFDEEGDNAAVEVREALRQLVLQVAGT
jgi:HK97 gp10 family phage protein